MTRYLRFPLALVSLIVLGIPSALQAQVALPAPRGAGENLIVSSSGSVGGPFNGVNINSLVGAKRFYDAGYTGSHAVVTNIEAGLAWNGPKGHETLTNSTVNLYSPDPIFTGTQLGEVDRHATWVSAAIAGNGSSAYQQGIAYGATLWSGAVATTWVGNPYKLSFDWSDDRAFLYPYLTAMQTGVGPNNRKTDVVNSSWGFGNPTGNDPYTITLDGLARANGTTVVLAAGNSGSGANTVIAPASGYNSIVAAALGADTDVSPYQTVTNFSSRGPQDYYDPNTGRTIAGVRARVDISAPGQNLTLAYYGGATGGNSGGTADGGVNSYSTQLAGTSFAAPIVAGAATLLDDVAYARFSNDPYAHDGRVIKVVLLNSAMKLAGWDNGQSIVNGVITTTQGLDYAQGAGRLDLNAGYDQYVSGTTDLDGTGGGRIQKIGWDYGVVSANSFNDYLFDTSFHAGDLLTATLNWMVDRTYDSIDASGNLTGSDLEFTNLDLQIWSVLNGTASTLIAQSDSLYNNTEHLYFTLPSAGDYLLRVMWAGKMYDFQATPQTSEAYGVAWSVQTTAGTPEPGTLGLAISLTLSLTGIGIRRLRRRKQGKTD